MRLLFLILLIYGQFFTASSALGQSSSILDQLYNNLSLNIESELDESDYEHTLRTLKLSIKIHDRRSHPFLLKIKEKAKLNEDKKLEAIFDILNSYYLAEYHADYETAIKQCNKAIAYFSSPLNKKYLAYTYAQQGYNLLWNKIGKKSSVDISWIEKELILMVNNAEELKDRNLEIITLEILASYYAVTNEGDIRATELFYKMQDLIDPHTYPESALSVNESLAIVAADAHHEIDMVKFQKRAEQSQYFNEIKYGKANMYRAIAKHYLHTKDPLRAEKYGLQALSTAEELDGPEYVSLGHQRMYEIYKHIGNSPAALHHLEQYKKLEDTIASKRLGQAYLQLDFASKESTIKSLELQNLSKTKKARNHLLLTLTLLCLITALGIIAISYYHRRLKQTHEKLQAEVAQIHQTIDEVKIKERYKLYQKINANLVPIARRLYLNKDFGPQDSNEPHYKGYKSDVENLYEELQKISNLANPQDLELYGLKVALQNLSNTINKANPGYLHIKVADDLDRSPNENKIYSIIVNFIDDALANNIRRILIEMSQERNETQISITYPIDGKANGYSGLINPPRLIKSVKIKDGVEMVNIVI